MCIYIVIVLLAAALQSVCMCVIVHETNELYLYRTNGSSLLMLVLALKCILECTAANGILCSEPCFLLLRILKLYAVFYLKE
jgi:hypothetical protein